MTKRFVSKFDKWPQYFELDQEADMKEPVKTEIHGTFPQWIDGSLYRNGSGLYTIGEYSFPHLFDGYAVIQRWAIKDGQVTFRSTILDSESYKRSVKANRIIQNNGFGVVYPDPCKSIFDRFFNYFKPRERIDNCAVNIVESGDMLLAMTESPLVYRVDHETMHAVEKLDINKSLAVHTGTAHPHFDKEGNMYYYATNFANKNGAYNFIKVPPAVEGEDPFTKAQVIASLSSRWKVNFGYTHSFGLTENYIVHFEHTVCFNTLNMMAAPFTGKSLEETMSNYPDEKVNVIVVNRHTGERLPVTYLAQQGFVFHFINCYEDSDHIIVDLCYWRDGNVMKEVYLDAIMDCMENNYSHTSIFARFVIPLKVEGAGPGENLIKLPDSKATAVLRPGEDKVVDLTCDHVFENAKSMPVELPRINYDYNARKYRYSYQTSIWAPERAMHKFDMETKKVITWKCGNDFLPGEPVFLKDPKGTKEDDGVVLSTILAKTTEESSYLVCLDASTFKEIARAVVPKHVKISYTFHGDFYKGPK